MKTIWGWIKKHLVKSILILIGILLALIIPPFVVHWMFKTPARNPFFIQTWGPGDLITYIAGFEAFVGTLVLGIVTVNLNKKSVELNRELILIEKTRSLYERKPTMKITEKDMTPTTIGELFDQDIPYYSYSGLREERDKSTSSLSQKIYLHKIVIHPLVNCDLQARVVELILTIFDKGDRDIIIEYDTAPELFFPDYFHIRDELYEFAFIHGNLVPSAHPIILGQLNIELTNNLLDTFRLSIRFHLNTCYEDDNLISSVLEVQDYYINPEY